MAAYIPYPFPIPENSPFPISNIPFGIFSTAKEPTPRPGTAVGDYVIDLSRLVSRGLLRADGNTVVQDALREPTLNSFAALPHPIRSKIRKDIQKLIGDEESPLYHKSGQSKFLAVRADVTMHLPFAIGGFTDYTCSLEHVTNLERLRGSSTIPPAFFTQPLAYNGRISSIVPSGTPIQRPYGLTTDRLYPSAKLDYEVELGMFVSTGVPVGDLIPASHARNHIFGFVLLNDWSARDVQFAEMVPLGPFNGKACGTSISVWVVTFDALEEAGAIIPVAVEEPVQGKMTSNPFLRHLEDISIDVSTYHSRNSDQRAPICRSNLKHSFWSPFQMLAHHTSAGCGLGPGDLIGTGTMSSSAEQVKRDFTMSTPGVGRLGCLQELTEGGAKPVQLGGDQSLTWLKDYDEVTLEGWAGEGRARIGFGEVTGRIVPSNPSLSMLTE
ncbi:hypothetical protein BDV25DRAFT_169360 [Aspergillus avenaceus]|uniref:Fumarylacetoacetase n=1 Tax=Aspergillus avenaceus TaxID=36643 RepID=A0A5N6TLC8_ASPAV|nr:hypothetical protein BDV25DRAFT_169360 [Aspergillus avenaceus]